MKASQEFSPAHVERFALLAGDRPFVTACPACFVPGFSLAPIAKGGLRLACLGCGLNGFVMRTDLAWGFVGCGEELKRLEFGALKRMRGLASRMGRPLVAEANWTRGQYGKTEADIRPVLVTAVGCFSCGGMGASMRRDSRGKAYLTCARGCRARVFIPDEPAMRRIVGWTVMRQQGPEGLWNTWFKDGRTAWMGWHAPMETEVAEGAARVDITETHTTSQEA